MNTTLRATLILTLFAACQVAFGAGHSASASFQATFVINEACTVQSGNHLPTVKCQFNAPYQVANTSANTSANASPARSDQTSATLVTITF